jgi:anti-sigma regulatory factor (Ser/Thr protein kinase)
MKMGDVASTCEVERQLTEELSSINEAREVVGRALMACGYRGEHDHVILLVSELVTNALIHGGGAPVLRLSCGEFRVRLEVGDARAEMPQPREPDADGGWGLHVVQEIATGWGTSPRAGGKVVWCEVEAHPAPVSVPGDITS